MNVRDMREDSEDLVVQIHFQYGRYYARMIGHNELAERIGLTAGLWTDTPPTDNVDKLIDVIKDMLANKIVYDEELDVSAPISIIKSAKENALNMYYGYVCPYCGKLYKKDDLPNDKQFIACDCHSVIRIPTEKGE